MLKLEIRAKWNKIIIIVLLGIINFNILCTFLPSFAYM